MQSDPLILALDVPTFKEAKEWVHCLYPQVRQFKIGSQLFTAEGPKVVDMVNKKGGRVFLDLKWHDIPNTVANACRQAVKMGVWMCNVHALGGSQMMLAAREAIDHQSRKEKVSSPYLVAVTILTSMDDRDLRQIGIKKKVTKAVVELTNLVQQAKLDGVVCSGHELKMIHLACGKDFLTVVPGIRNPFEPVSQKDQKRVLAPQEALANGADYIVMGRSILNSSDPVKWVQRIRNDH